MAFRALGASMARAVVASSSAGARTMVARVSSSPLAQSSCSSRFQLQSWAAPAGSSPQRAMVSFSSLVEAAGGQIIGGEQQQQQEDGNGGGRQQQQKQERGRSTMGRALALKGFVTMAALASENAETLLAMFDDDDDF